MPREIIKFDLADAKIPDFHPQYQQQKQQPQQKPKPSRRSRQKRPKPTEPAASVPIEQDKPEARDKLDTYVAASRIVQISHPPPSAYESTAHRQRVVKELPFGVQKAINHALKQDFNIPYLDTIKYYFKDPVVRTSSPPSKLAATPNALKTSFSENRLKQWWQPSSSIKSSSPPSSIPTSYSYSTTPKTTSSAEVPSTDYSAYPLLRAYPVQYAMNVASDLVDGIGFLYGDRIYTKVPYSYGKTADSSNALLTEVSVKPLETPTAVFNENLGDEYITVTPHSSSSTSPVQFPPVPKSTKPKPSLVKYYAAVSADEGGIPLSSDKNTLNLINKAVNAIKKHNPHLDVVPKKVENDELIVHVTPKPEYFTASDATKTLTSSKNLAYVTQKIVENDKLVGEPVLNKQKITKVVNHHYLKQIQAVANNNNDDLVRWHRNKQLIYCNQHTHTHIHTDLHEQPYKSIKCVIHKHFLLSIFQFESGYAFGYRVRDHTTGNDFGHHQKRMVDGTTHGEYKILMPDGRTQNVKYKADDHGYHADVSYEE